MGLYDGDDCSADLAAKFGIPVALVIDVRAMAQTAAAIAVGLRNYRDDFDMVGVIANKCGSKYHGQLVRDALPDDLPLWAALKRDESIPSEQKEDWIESRLESGADLLEEAGILPFVDTLKPVPFMSQQIPAVCPDALLGKTIAIARDDAFSFTYTANITLLQDMGAKICYFSPIRDDSIPTEATAVWLPGGYPELHAKALSENTSMISSLKQFHDDGKPILAECGGEAEPPAATASDRTANATAASNVMSSLAGLGSTSSEDEKQKEKDVVGGTSLLKESSSASLPSRQQQQPKQQNTAWIPATSSNDSSAVIHSSGANGAAIKAASKPAATISNLSKSQPLRPSPSKPQQSAKAKAPATVGTADGKKKKKEKDDKKKTSKKKSSVDGKKGKDKVKKKKEKVKSSLESKTKNLAKKLPTSATSSTPASSTGYSAQQAAVNDMMRRALEEDQYSALGSVDYNPRLGVGKPILNRNTLLVAMKRHMRMEAMNTLSNFDGKSFLEDAEEYVERGGKASSSFVVNKAPTVLPDNNDDEELDVNGRRIGKRRKKKKQNRRGGGGNAFMSTPDASIGGQGVGSGGMDDDDGVGGGGVDSSGFDEDSLMAEDAEISIFGQTAGSSNATWVECDRCKKWRRLRGVVDARKLPSKWYCSMNKNDPERARCSAPEEEYDAATTPESAMDQRTRKHLRLWVRRLHGNEAYENRQRKKRSGTANAKEPYEWIRCCNPSCGKWRMLLRSMDASTIMDQCKDGEWYCVMNTWDEKAASCGAAQENLPALGCPPWVMRDH
ncbi:cobyrinate a,c-diamide synthase [Skeletonema marinoi]|uniref:Cobyrinate a,c-diamide synthase n=1 Tax=Skeletonema marinoi TaxID=267567 RepID=A0AAD9D8P8_9STRA|nr:cobyrinate a,c-diamide synthase [Skeletonema marinoi]